MSYFTHSLSSPLSNISDHDISGINVFCAHSVKYRRFKWTLDNNEWYILTFLRERERERERERDTTLWDQFLHHITYQNCRKRQNRYP